MGRNKTVNILKEFPGQWDVKPKGSPTGSCEDCGAKFSQDYFHDKNRYTSYRKCPECRTKRIRKNNPIEIAKLQYNPFPAQKLFHDSKARFRVLCCGNRFGKDFCTTMEGIRIFAELLNENRYMQKQELTPSVYWWIIAPTEKLAKQNWADLKKYFPKDWVVDISNSNFTMNTIGDGVIEVRSGYDPEALVGVGLDLVTITEAARISDLKKAWGNLRARLDSKGRGLSRDKPPHANFGWGKAIINSSPLGKNDFYELFLQGQKDSDRYMGLFESWQFDCWQNPSMAEMRYLSVETRHGQITYEESLIADMGLRKYKENYLAEFMEDVSAVFPDFENRCVEYMPLEWSQAQRQNYIEAWRRPEPYYNYILGYDPAAGGGDIPGLIVREVETGKIKKVYDMSGMGWGEQWDQIVKVSVYYKNAPVAFSKTGHETIEESLRGKGLQLAVWDERGGSKVDMVVNLQTVTEQKALRILADGTPETTQTIRQFKDYTSVRRGGITSYSNNKEAHDDYVSCAYVAFYGGKIEKKPPPFIGAVVSC